MASRQWGNITRRQLRDVGFSAREIDGMVERGLLHRLHRGVYAFGARSPAPESRWAAALLAAGPGAALSHTTAAAFYGQLAVREVIEVTAPTHRRGDERCASTRAKRVRDHRHKGLRITTPAQTLLDLAATGWPIDRTTHDMAAASLVSIDDLRTFARNKRGEPGARALAKALDLPHTRSEWERHFLRWVQTLDDLPQPILNDPIGPLTVDCHWPDHGLVIELDTDQTHGSAWKKRNDRQRDRWLQTRGKDVVRVQREDWDPAQLAAQLRRRLT